MTTEWIVEDSRDLLFWSDVFRVLGIRRCHPLLGKLGVNAYMVGDPAGLIDASAYFWQQRLDGIRYRGKLVGAGYNDPDFPQNYLMGISSLLNETFKIISANYGSKRSLALNDWARRNFVDQTAVDLWSTWALLFRGSSFDNFFSEDPAALNLISKIVSRHFAPSIRDREKVEIEALVKIPLSDFEQKMVAHEITRSTDMPEVDLLGLLGQVLGMHHAFSAWQELHASCSEDQKEMLLWWAYALGAEIGLSASDIQLPSVESFSRFID